MSCFETRFRVRYAETDQMGIVYYANYLIWMEIGRVEYCRQAGFAYAEMEAEHGVLLTVVEANCRYKFPARYDEEIFVRTRILRSNPKVIVFGYEIVRAEDGRLLAEGDTKHVFCSRDLKPVRAPERYFASLGIARAPAASAP